MARFSLQIGDVLSAVAATFIAENLNGRLKKYHTYYGRKHMQEFKNNPMRIVADYSKEYVRDKGMCPCLRWKWNYQTIKKWQVINTARIKCVWLSM